MLPIRDHLRTRRIPVVNYLLIAANVLGFIWERLFLSTGYSPLRLVYDVGLVPARFLRDPVLEAPTLLTSMFMHDPTGWIHIGGNMLFLWIFGDNVEDAMGRGRYLLFYLLAGLFAAFTQILIDPSSTVPMVGASGAIAGVLAAYVSLYPRSPITIFNPFIPLWLFFGLFLELPAWFVIGEFFLLNLWRGLGSLGDQGGGVAFFAHVGGFAAGLLLVRLFIAPGGPGAREHARWAGLRSKARRSDGSLKARSQAWDDGRRA
jgi:membrane associated rhomboid family serine protease